MWPDWNYWETLQMEDTLMRGKGEMQNEIPMATAGKETADTEDIIGIKH